MAKIENAPEMRPREFKDGSGWYVFVELGNRPPLQVGSFSSEAEAQEWIDKSSLAWLKKRAQGIP